MDSFPCLWFMIMFMITNFIETRMGNLLLSHLIGNNYPEFHNGLLDSYFFKPTWGSGCLELCFWAVTFKTILTLILQIYQSLSSQSFKHSSANMPSSNAQPAFTCSRNTKTRVWKMLKVNNKDTRTWRRSGVFIANFKHISHFALCFSPFGTVGVVNDPLWGHR